MYVCLLPVLSDFSKRVWASYQLVQGLREIGEGRPMRALLLPAIQHQLIDSFRAIHRCWKPVTLLDGLYHILIRPVPIWSLAVRHHFPAHDTHTPDVGGTREFTESYCLRCRPPYRDFAALNRTKWMIQNFYRSTNSRDLNIVYVVVRVRLNCAM